MDEITNTLIAKWYMAQSNYGTVAAREFSDWAVSQLEQGRDSKNLRMLASLVDAEQMSDVEDHFRKTLTELSWDFPDCESTVERYSRLIMHHITTGVTKPYDGCRELYNMCTYLNLSGEFIQLECPLLGRGRRTSAYLDKLIVEEARRTLAGEESAVLHEGTLYMPRSERVGFWTRLKEKLF